MSLTAFHATRSRDDIVTGFDLELRRVQVERLISLMPSVEFADPADAAFVRRYGRLYDRRDGCGRYDEMNIELPTLNAACSIRGENLVLLDGETFTEISQDAPAQEPRARCIIDRISVDLLVHDNRIELFPFMVGDGSLQGGCQQESNGST